ncbi:hypothetical protein ACOSQ3_029177 [Xanthoceras sorbifolium]
MTLTIPSQEFEKVRYVINANPTSAPRQATPTTLISSAGHLIFKLGFTASDLNPVILKGDQTLELYMIDAVRQLPTVSTVAPTVNLTPHGPTQVHLANAETIPQPLSTIMDTQHALSILQSTGMVSATSTLSDPK